MSDRDEIRTFLGAEDLDIDDLRNRYAHERDRRLRGDAVSQYVEVTAEFSYFEDDPYSDPGFTRAAVSDEMHTTIIGAGFWACSLQPDCAIQASMRSA